MTTCANCIHYKGLLWEEGQCKFKSLKNEDGSYRKVYIVQKTDGCSYGIDKSSSK